MLKAITFFCGYLFFVSATGFAQQQNFIIVNGDSLSGRMVNGESIRDVYGHVVLNQGNVRITCDHAIQYISRNDAELIGNVIATQDTLTITTSHGFYYGNDRKAQSNSGVTLNDKKVILTADTGVYFFDQNRAEFNSNVKLVDTSSTLTSQTLVYYKDQGKTIAVGNVKIVESKNIIKADSLVHFRDSRITFADNHVRISSTANNSIIFGNHLEDYPEKFYTVVTKNPLFMQIDSSYIKISDTTNEEQKSDSLKIDTLIIKSEKMEAYRDTINIFKAEDSVRIVRGDFASRNDYTEYFRSKGEIVTKKISENSNQPIIWYENSQLTGDSVAIFLRENKIYLLDVDRNAFILSQNDKYKNRFDQMSGTKIKIHFDDNGIRETDVFGGIHSIYYLYEENDPNGLTKSSSDSAKILFSNKKVGEVKLFGSPTSEYHPENKVEGNELAFTLPGFTVYKNRPIKDELLSQNIFNKNELNENRDSIKKSSTKYLLKQQVDRLKKNPKQQSNEHNNFKK